MQLPWPAPTGTATGATNYAVSTAAQRPAFLNKNPRAEVRLKLAADGSEQPGAAVGVADCGVSNKRWCGTTRSTATKTREGPSEPP